MKKSGFVKIAVSAVFILVICGGIIFLNNSLKEKGAITEQAAVRDAGIPADGVIYIEPEMVSLADSLAGNADSQAAAKAAFDLTNKKRQEAGLSALTWDSGLEQACAVRAVEAAQSFSHTRPDGTDWWTVNSNIMYGENLAKGYFSADSVVNAWMNSPTHKANIMDSEFTSGAIAVHIGSNGQWFWAQEFGF